MTSAASNNDKAEEKPDDRKVPTDRPKMSFEERLNYIRRRNIEKAKHISPHADIIVDLDSSPAISPSVSVVSLPKPALRFVKDLTYPDGSSVPPLTVFRKAWKVRNDGTVAWPEECVLVTAGGDKMCEESLKAPLPTLDACEEAEVAVELLAPELPGLYTTYFRAQTREGQLFGHRLWAAILVVATEERGWQVIGPKDPLLERATVAAVELEAVLEEDGGKNGGDGAAETMAMSTAIAAISSTESFEEQVQAGVAEAIYEETSTANAVKDEQMKPFGPSTMPAPIAPAPEPGQTKPLFVLWRRELEVLADMGFADAEVNLPLLQKHLVTPLALTGDRNAVPNMEGMQRVVASLLGKM